MSRPAINLHDLGYLQLGTPRQRQAHAVIEAVGVFADLARYSPALAGTIPLDIDIEGSDLDVICRAADLEEFAHDIKSRYDRHESFQHCRLPVRGVDSVVVNFRYAGWGFELFAQDVPVAGQFACLHLLVEDRLLRLASEAAREAIRQLKRDGLKTEPAFAHYFGLAGDPYEELARLAWAKEDELREVVCRVSSGSVNRC